jgi:hypothetical protein
MEEILLAVRFAHADLRPAKLPTSSWKARTPAVPSLEIVGVCYAEDKSVCAPRALGFRGSSWSPLYQEQAKALRRKEVSPPSVKFRALPRSKNHYPAPTRRLQNKHHPCIACSQNKHLRSSPHHPRRPRRHIPLHKSTSTPPNPVPV